MRRRSKRTLRKMPHRIGVQRMAKNESRGLDVVYGHRMRGQGVLFHIGSGSEQRARTLTNRSSLWQQFVGARGGIAQIEVEILERHLCPARARLREMELVRLHQPATNVFGRASIPPSILAGHPKGSSDRCNCRAPDCYGAEVGARSGSPSKRRRPPNA